MDEPNARALARFLRAIASGPRAASHVFLVGDVFDLWIGSHAYFIDAFRPIVDACRELVRAGIELHAFEGNHDLYLDKFWGDDVGARVHREAASFRLGSARVRVEHGDLINLEDRGYLALRRALRSPAVEWLASNLPARAVAAIGRRMSEASRTYTSTGAKRADAVEIREMIRAHARRAYQQTKFDLLIAGHVHVQDDWSFEPEAGVDARSVNLGWWRDLRQAFLIDESAGIRSFVDVDAFD